MDGTTTPDDASRVTDAELRALMTRARDEGDGPLRRLITGYLMLRSVTSEVVTLVSAREGGTSIANTPILRRARELSTGWSVR